MKLSSHLNFSAFLIIVFTGCSQTSKLKAPNDYLINPPNCVKINDALYCDKSEVANIDWRAYMAWTKVVFGENSQEHKATFPDQSVWNEKDTCLNRYFELYLWHPSYDYYPVVGITQIQVMDYSKWRSDRVFEMILIKYGKLKINPGQTREMHFTIERYFKGEYFDIKPDPNFQYFPNFRLPTLEERSIILKYADSVDKAYFDNCNSKFCKECKVNYPKFSCDILPCSKYLEDIDITKNTYWGCTSKKDGGIYNLRGNVSEWTSENEICVGGGWTDSRDSILKNDTFRLETRNAWTGFRNICEWKIYKVE
ncbi:MAG: SUMF1/EgtB/PvdO family nonheme iron enzyme [Saprospiraceae bacterium]|nr:SUMF1/EgtB/PvdO family nonheme iron enzyme [Saprospiraceae bacterium]